MPFITVFISSKICSVQQMTKIIKSKCGSYFSFCWRLSLINQGFTANWLL